MALKKKKKSAAAAPAIDEAKPVKKARKKRARKLSREPDHSPRKKP
jgi:hypothetical protein